MDKSTDIKKTWTIFKQKIYVWVYKQRLKETMKVVFSNIILSQKILAEDYEKKYPMLNKKAIYELARIVIEQIFNSKLPEKESDFYKENKEKIEAEIDLASRNIRIIDKYKLHLQLLKYYYGDVINLMPDSNPHKHKLLNEDINLLSKEEFKEKKKSILREAKIAKKEIIEAIKIVEEIKELEKLEKIEITSQRITTLIALISVLFLSTGFIYNQIYLRYFGMELSKFFSISDYLSTSADKIFYSVITIIITFAIALIVFPEYIRGEFPKLPPSKRISKISNVMFNLLIPITLFATISAYFSDDPKRFHSTLQSLIYFMLLLILSKTIKYFKNPAGAYLFIMAILIFFTSISFKAISDINHIVHDDLNEIKNYKIKFVPELDIDEENLVLLTSNNNWFFFYDKATKQTEIIPSKDIIKIESTKKIDSFFYNFLIEHFQKEKLSNKHPS